MKLSRAAYKWLLDQITSECKGAIKYLSND